MLRIGSPVAGKKRGAGRSLRGRPLLSGTALAAGSVLLAASCGFALDAGSTATGPASSGPQPMTGPVRGALKGAALHVDPHAAAWRQVADWRQSRPAEATLVEREIASQPTGIWFGDWNRDVAREVAQVVGDAARQGAVPVLVAYNIPQRDCGLHSAGGARSADAYRGWIRDFARGVGRARAVVILEPDALAATDCLTPAQRAERFGLLAHAVDALSAQGVLVYIDAGHANWLSAAETAARLTQAGIARAAGFALNVSNFVANSANISFGDDVSRRTGGAHFVIDTSRNGVGAEPGGKWCNPAGRALGTRPTTRTAHARLDALLWIKKPGESDGACNGGPAAGQWWADYALGLAARSTPVMALADAAR
jgi:endoglucanase